MASEALTGKHSVDVAVFISCMCLIQMRQQRDFSIREQCNSVTSNKDAVGFHVVIVVVMRSPVFWETEVNQRFLGICRLHFHCRKVSQTINYHVVYVLVTFFMLVSCLACS
jgi:hypothetical protein